MTSQTETSQPVPPATTTAYSPAETARVMEDAMVAKATAPALKGFLQSLGGGAFIAIGFVFFVTTKVGAGTAVPWGLSQLVGGLVFSLGLMLVVITGSDLFTSTTMTLMARASRRITWGRLFAHWVRCYVGNAVGAAIMIAICRFGGLPEKEHGAWGTALVSAASGKVAHTWGQAFFLGIGCNLLVCLAVWMANSGRTTTDKLLAVVLPVGLFVAVGFEHSVANMFLLPFGALLDPAHVPWSAVFLKNLVPVTLGNIVGGGVLVGMYQWWIHRSPSLNPPKGS